MYMCVSYVLAVSSGSFCLYRYILVSSFAVVYIIIIIIALTTYYYCYYCSLQYTYVVKDL
jgi:hypothetical protein